MTKTKFDFKKLIPYLIILTIVILIAVFWNKIFGLFKVVAHRGDLVSLREYVQRQGFVGVFLIGFLQVLQVVFTVFPSEPMQIAAGISYGTFYGVILIAVGVFIGSQIMFYFTRYAKSTIKSKKQNDLKNDITTKISHSTAKFSVLIFLLYVVPAVPFGLIAIIAASSNISWWKFCLITTLGSIFPIWFTVLLGSKLVTSNPLVTTIMVCVVFVIVILVLFNKKKIINLIFRNPKSLDEKLNVYKPNKPSKFLYAILLPIFKKIYLKKANAKYNFNIDIKELKEPFLLLSTHPSKIDYVYVCSAMLPHKMHIVMNRYFFHQRYFPFLLKNIGAIPKHLWLSDTNAMRNIFRCIKKGRAVNLYPEGINSLYGASKNVIPSTSKLIKKLGIPVISVVIDGAFLTRPKWNSQQMFTGEVNITVDKLFDKEEIESSTNEELLEKMNNTLVYNDYEYAIKNDVHYNGENKAVGMENALFRCPKCHTEFEMKTAGEEIWCEHCKNTIVVDDQFKLTPKTLDDVCPKNVISWSDDIFDSIKQEIENENFKLSEKCLVETFKRSGFKKYYKFEGLLTVEKEGVHFDGYNRKTGVEEHIFVRIDELPNVGCLFGKSVDFYVGNDSLEFFFEHGVVAAKFSKAIEFLHNKYSD